MLTELSPYMYSPLRTESPTNHTPTPTVDAMDAAIRSRSTCTAQTNFIDGVELESDFFFYCDNLIDEKEIFMIYVVLIDIRSTNASAAEFILHRLKLYLAGRHHHHRVLA